MRPSLLKKGKNNFSSKLDSANTFLIFLLNPNSNPTFLLTLFQSQFPKVTGNCVNKQLKTLFFLKKKKKHKKSGTNHEKATSKAMAISKVISVDDNLSH
jgi:hypothetical protein